MNARGAQLWVVALVVGGCLESPFAPAPVTPDNCGRSEDEPCRLSCELGCADAVVDATAACMLPLEGTLDASRTRCSFADGSKVAFAWPLPASQLDLSSRSWEIRLFGQDGSLCLGIKSQPLPWVGGGFESVTEVTTPSGSYRQRLVMSAAADAGSFPDAGPDGGPVDIGVKALPRPDRLEVRCLSGKHHAGSGPALCAGCAAGDCRNLPLVEVRGLWQPALELSLQSTGGSVTPLFTCR